MVEVEERNPLEQADPLAERFVQGVAERVAGFDDVWDEGEVNPVETKAYDGFIPYTDGGYETVLRASMSYAYGSGCGPSVVLADAEGCIKDAEEEFERQHGLSVAKLYEEQAELVALWEQPALPEIGKGPYPEHPMMQKWHELQDSWLSEGGTYFYKVRVMFYEPDNSRNELGDYEVRMFAYLNTDYEYGRDSIGWLTAYGKSPDQTSGTWERTFTAAEFNALGEDGIDALIDDAVGHLECL